MMFKLFNVGFGESILLSNPKKNKCLLVDCGSESDNKTAYFNNILRNLDCYCEKSAVITHFHNDHINGFIYIIDKNPHQFDRVYIPNVFTSKISQFNNSLQFNIVDLEIVKLILESKKCNSRKKLSILELLKALVKSSANIKIAERGYTFNEIDNDFHVLWPDPNRLFDENLSNELKTLLDFEINTWNKVNELSNQINTIFIYLLDRRASYQDEQNIRNITEEINRIDSQIDDLIDNTYRMHLSKNMITKWLDRIKKIENNTSIVMHSNFNENPILLTGDIGSSILEKICEDKYIPSMKIFDYYKVIKASHHGTDSNHFVKFDVYTKYDIIAISNGETNIRNRGKISKKYTSKFNKHRIYCSNCINDRCQYYMQYSKCCINAEKCNLKMYMGDINVI